MNLQTSCSRADEALRHRVFQVAAWVWRVFQSGVPRLRFLLLHICLTTLTACGREPAADAELRGATAAEDGPAGSVWVVDSASGGRLYLCGTIHILREADYPLAPGYEAAYSSSERLIFELPPGAGTGAGTAARMKELGALPRGTTLEGTVGAEIWDGVKKWCSARGVPSFTMSGLRPWFVSLMITNTEYSALGASPSMGVDQHFEKRAKRDGKPAEGLETLEFQLQLFAGLSHDLQKAMLEQTLAEVATLPVEYEKMITAWKHGRLDDLHAMLFREAAKYPELMELFLAARNRAWMKRLEELLAGKGASMVLVGTGHFTADTGLLELLRERGHTVRHYSELPVE